MSTCVSIPDCNSFNRILGPITNNSLTLIHVNIRSLRKHWDEFQISVCCLKPSVDIFVITEITVTSLQCNQFVLDGYKEFFCTRDNSRGGGIAVYIQNKWLPSSYSVSFQHAESIGIKLLHSDFSLFLLAVYRPPSENVSLFLAELEVVLGQLRSEGQLCLVGGFNIDTLKPSKSTVCNYLTLLSEHGIENTISLPTREETLSGKLVVSCLDHINIRSTDILVKSAVISEKLSDHYFIGCHLQQRGAEHKTNKSGCVRVTISDPIKFDALVAAFDWDDFLQSNQDPNLYSAFVEVLKSFYVVSKKEVIFKKRSDKPWFNTDIMKAIKTKEALGSRSRRTPKNEELRAEYRSARNRVNAIIRSAKRHYFQKQFFECRSNP